MAKCASCDKKCKSKNGKIIFCDECTMRFITLRIKYCNKCLIEKTFDEFHKDKIKFLGLSSNCLDCDQIYNNSFDRFFQNMVRTARKSSKKRLKKRVLLGEFEITTNSLKSLWKKQNGLCFLSNIPMKHETYSDFKCSVERIDNNTDYTIDNVVLIINELNTPKQWNKEKLNYMKNNDITIQHPKIEEINTKVGILPPLKKPHSCRTCLSNIIYTNGYCTKCYQSRNIKVVLLRILNSCKLHTKYRNNVKNRQKTECTILIEDLWEQLKKQKGKCYYSGINMTIGIEEDWAISIERLNIHDGYNKDNIVFICNEFNSGDKSVNSSRYEKSGSSGWDHEKIALLRSL